MRIGSAERRLNIRLWGFALLTDVVVAAVIAFFAFDREDWVTNTFLVWLAIQVISILLAILGAIRLVAINWAGGFRPAKDGLLTALEAANFPAPEPYVHSVDDYLGNVADNEDQDIQTRLAAATVSGARQGIKAMAGFLKGMMIDNAHEEALKEYAARFPPGDSR